MNHRTNTICMVLPLFVASLLPVGVAWAAPPHMVLIMADDLGWKDLHCQGNDRMNTPRLDALAR